MKITKTTLGKKIKEQRRKKGLSQDTLAERIGIDPKHLSRIEVGRSYPSLETLSNIAQALAIEIKDLFDLIPQNDKKILRKKIMELLKRADEDDLRLILKFTTSIIR